MVTTVLTPRMPKRSGRLLACLIRRCSTFCVPSSPAPSCRFGFPGGTAEEDDDQLHTSDPARALSRLLLAHLAHHGLDLVEAIARIGERPVLPEERMGVGLPSVRDAEEENEASAELV